MSPEINRLEDLAKVNDNVRPEEITHLKNQKDQTLKALSDAKIAMNAVRVLVCIW